MDASGRQVRIRHFESFSKTHTISPIKQSIAGLYGVKALSKQPNQAINPMIICCGSTGNVEQSFDGLIFHCTPQMVN
jgi:hypothetical protein